MTVINFQFKNMKKLIWKDLSSNKILKTNKTIKMGNPILYYYALLV
jgi:hypothetical protein